MTASNLLATAQVSQSIEYSSGTSTHTACLINEYRLVA